MFDRLDQISVENRAIQEAGQTLILVGQGLLTLRDIDDDLRRRVGKIITARDTECCDICTSLRRLALDEAESAAPRAQREILEIALLLEAGKDAFAAWPAGFRNLSFERMSS
jgi:sugar phosphate isomerase/epimerase